LSSKSLLYSAIRYPRYLKSVTCSIALLFITILTLCIRFPHIAISCSHHALVRGIQITKTHVARHCASAIVLSHWYEISIDTAVSDFESRNRFQFLFVVFSCQWNSKRKEHLSASYLQLVRTPQLYSIDRCQKPAPA
jgi:hypothetical protein